MALSKPQSGYAEHRILMVLFIVTPGPVNNGLVLEDPFTNPLN
jgi:hypothetical protein